MLIAMRWNTLPAMVFVTFIMCGCQSSNSKLVRTTQERTPASSQVDESGDARRSAPSMNGKKRDTSDRLADEPANIAEKQRKLTKDAIQVADLMEQGNQLRRSGKLDDARLVYQSALSISPKNPEVNHCLAIIADKQQKFALADQHYQAALKVLPNDLSLLSDLGYSYSLRGDAEEAEKTWKQALEIDPTHRGALSNLAAIYAKQDRKDEAFTLFQNSGATSKEAQQHLARLFPPQSVDGVVVAGQKLANVSRQKTAPAIDDINNLSVEQLQAEIVRRQNPTQVTQDRGADWDSHESQNNQGAPLQGDRPKAKLDPEIQQTAGAVHAILTDVTPQNGTPLSASQLAMRIGMNSGPGQMFPFVAGKENAEPVTKGMPTSGLDSRGRFGSQSSLTGFIPTTAKTAIASAGLNSTRAAPPKRESFRAQPANLRDQLQGLQDSVSWDSDTQAAQETQHPLDQFLP
jgi:Flp pilus assembly protein TadD